MTNAEIINAVIAATADATEISETEIRSKSRMRETVDARHIAIKVIHDMGIYVSRIAAHLHITERNVHYALTAFEERLRGNPLMRNNYEIVRNKVRKWLETSN